MKATLVFAAAILLVLMVGCGERNSPMQPGQVFRLVSEVQTPGWAKDVAVLNDTAYVADNSGGIAIIDIRDAANPVFLESLPTNYVVRRIFIAPINRLLITYEYDLNGGIKFYSLDSRQLVGEFFDYGVRDVAFFETVDYIWIFDTEDREGFRGLQVHYEGDYWFSHNTVETSEVPGFGESREMDITEDPLLFVCQDDYGILALAPNFESSPCTVNTLGWLDTPGAAYDVVYKDGYLYVADYFGGLVVINASDPTDMTQVAQVVPRGADRCVNVIVDGTYLALMDQYDGIFVYNISNPTSPVLLDQIELPEPQEMIFSDGRLLVVDEARGLMIFQE